MGRTTSEALYHLASSAQKVSTFIPVRPGWTCSALKKYLSDLDDSILWIST